MVRPEGNRLVAPTPPEGRGANRPNRPLLATAPTVEMDRFAHAAFPSPARTITAARGAEPSSGSEVLEPP